MIDSKYASRKNTTAKRENCKRILECIKRGDSTVGTIYHRFVAMGMTIQRKNIFPYLEYLKEQGEIVCLGGRPQKWVPADKVEKLPVEPLPPELQLLMGYNPYDKPKGTVVSPLTQLELGNYGVQPARKSKFNINIQSGLRGTIYHD